MIYKVQHQVGVQTYLAPEMVGSYIDCRHYIMDRFRESYFDANYDNNVTTMGGLMGPLNGRGIGAVSMVAIDSREYHMWFIRPQF